MTTVLVAATAQPLRLRGNDAALFAKAEREIEANLMSVPSWVLEWLDWPPAARIPVAMDWLQVLGLARRAGNPGDDLRFETTSQGRAMAGRVGQGTAEGDLRSSPLDRQEFCPFSRRPMRTTGMIGVT